MLEGYDTSKWTLKHKVTTLEIFGRDNIQFGYDVCDADYRVIVVHLEWNLIFLVREDKNCSEVHVISISFLSSPTRKIKFHSR